MKHHPLFYVGTFFGIFALTFIITLGLSKFLSNNDMGFRLGLATGTALGNAFCHTIILIASGK